MDGNTSGCFEPPGKSRKIEWPRVPRLAGRAALRAFAAAALVQACGEPGADPRVGGEAPTAAFGHSCNGLACEFDGSTSSDDGTIVQYAWELGDGSAAAGVTVQHTYSSVGQYDVQLTVVDNENLAATTHRTVDPTAGLPSTWIFPGHDIQAAVNGHPAGTEFLIKAGVHRLQSVQAKTGNAFIGEVGAVLSGAGLLTEFARDGRLWVAAGQTQENPRYGPNLYGDEVCAEQRRTCIFPEDLYVDGQPLEQVTQRSAVEPGKWYFDYAADRIYFADDPTGRTVEIGVVAVAVIGDPADGLVVRNLVVEKYANAGQSPVLGSFNSDDVVFEGNEVRLNHGVGIAVVAGARGSIVGNHVHHQGQLGIAAVATTDLLVEGNEIAYNNYAGYSMFWEAGGTKFTSTRDLTVRGNHSHHNDGPGLWTDIDNLGTLYEDNLVTDNARAGIWHEISYDAVIRNNTVIGNVDGIGIAHSPNVEVYGNVVRDNGEGIVGFQQDRGSGLYGPYEITNLYVHDNQITMSSGGTGLIQQVGDNSYFTSRNNRFENNMYFLGSWPRYFYWMNNFVTAEQWRAFGQDVSGTFNRR